MESGWTEDHTLIPNNLLHPGLFVFGDPAAHPFATSLDFCTLHGTAKVPDFSIFCSGSLPVSTATLGPISEQLADASPEQKSS